MITRTPIEPENHPSNKEHGGGSEAKDDVKHTTKQSLYSRARFSQATLLHLGISFLLVIALVGFLSSCGSTDNDEPYRTIDGSGNNKRNPQMNQAEVQLIRLADPDYADGISSLAGADRPNPRTISNKVNVHPLPGSNLVNEQGLIPNPDSATNFVWLWGQFMDHDITFSEDRAEPANIKIPSGDDIFDPQSTGTVEMFFNRAMNDPETGSPDKPENGPRQQLNKITGWIDASTVYGSDSKRANALRTSDESGKLKTSSGNFLPYNEQGLPNFRFRGPDFFLAGDERANENIGLTSLHTLFVREHNRLAEKIKENNPGLSGEKIYQMARKMVGAQIQAIAYNEFLPVLLGPNTLPPYSHYDDSTPSGVANSFSSAAYRVGHTLLSPKIRLVDAQGNEIETIPLRDAFFQPKKVVDGGIEPILRGFTSHPHQRVDVFIIDDVRNFLFVDTEPTGTGTPPTRGFDLASLNIHRGRDHGLPSYNDMREALGLGRKKSFSDITKDPEVQRRLRDAYGTKDDGTDNTDDMDIWVAGLAEDRYGESMLGELFHTIVARQFEVLRDGDRFWYQRTLSEDELREVEEESTLAEVIRRNTDVGDELSDNVFIVE